MKVKMTTTLTPEAQVLIEGDINLSIPWYLSASYAYYKYDESLLTDEHYDQLCGTILERWDEITHMHKHFVEKEMLRAGTGYDLDYAGWPLRIILATTYLIDRLHEKNEKLFFERTD